jgi:hypothetical protein
MPFWGRQGSNPDTSCTLIDLTGNQQETYPFECEKCQHRNEAKTTSEKGIDTAITTHLLDTADRWESACIVSNDVDFVPPVVSLRRRGKRVFCAVNDFSRDQAGTALVQACQSHFILGEKHLLSDYRAFIMCRHGGNLDRMVDTAVRRGLSDVRVRILSIHPSHGIRRLYFSAAPPDNRELQDSEYQDLSNTILQHGVDVGFELENAQGLKRGTTLYGTEDPRLIDGIERHATALTPAPAWLPHRDARTFRL